MKKRILHILVFPKFAGSQRIVYEILKGLSNENFEKYVLFGYDESINENETKETFKYFQELNVKVIQCTSLRRNIGFSDFKAFMFIYNLCREYKFDIVHTNSTKPGIIGRIAAKIAGIKLVVHTVHGLAFHKFVSWPKWIFFYVCELIASIFCDKIILVNKYYFRYFKLFEKKTITIYNAIDFKNIPINKIKVNSNSPIIKLLFVGRLDFPKDPLTLLRAINHIVNIKKIVNIELTMLGDGELYELCKNYIIENNLSQFVFLKGWKTNISSYYLSHDIVCNSSIYEAFGLIFLEAGYFSLPSIATKVEGIPEIVLDGKTGKLVSCRDYIAFANEIIELANDPQLRLRLGQNANNWILNEFNIENMVNNYLKVYNN